MPHLIDSHCHIDFACFDEDREAILTQCRQQGMAAIVVPGVSRSLWQPMADVIAHVSNNDSLPRLLPAYGLHPCFMDQHQASHLDELAVWLQQGAVAVGEIGLDAFHGDADLPAQITLFRAQLMLARDMGLPVIIHARKTQDLVLKLVRETGFRNGGILHAFSGSLQQAQRAVELGFLIGFGGAATYDRASRLRGILQALPPEAIVFETDAPDIPPSFARDQRNTPANLFRIVEILAHVLQRPVPELWQQSSQNLERLFRICL